MRMTKPTDAPATVAEQKAEDDFIKAMQQGIAKDIPTPWAPGKDPRATAGSKLASPRT